MRCLVLIAVVITVVVARPETYKEKEDFQYSRSSSDDGSKSGYYGAQRGNMGGNYERAHNMDSLAQHQMSGLIHQVEGELGDTSNTNAGSVFTAANSRGMYGSGHYDLSNLEGRNFQEGSSYGDSQSQRALTNSAYRNHASGFSNSNSYSHSSRQSSSDRSEYEQRKHVESSNLRSGESAYQHEHGTYGGSASQDYSWSPYQNRLVSTRPMRILLRPGTKATVPLATQTFDTDHRASSYDALAYNHNAAKSDAEVIINNDHETNSQVPASKHYESSYSYRKEWEKHHSSPGAVPLGVDIDSSIPKTSELYDAQHSQTHDNQHQYASNTANSHNHQSSNLYGYNSKSSLASSSQSKLHSDYDAQRESMISGVNDQDYANQQGLVNSKPKSFQSSYSYHKSWERQGDPYVIVPVPDVQNGQASERLSTASNSHGGYSSHQYGSNRKQFHQSYTSSNGLMNGDCDEDHIRVARSYNTDQEVKRQHNQWEDFSQQSQIEDLGQTQSHFDKIEDLGQKSQNPWDKTEDLTQQTQTHFDKIEDLGQQPQNPWYKTEDLTQQTQTHFDKIEDLGQQSQNPWEKTEDLTQQTQTHFDKIEDLGQQSQNPWDKTEDLTQQTQTHFDKIEDLGQQSQNPWNKTEDLTQQTQTHFDKIEDLGQQSQNPWDKMEDHPQQTQTHFDKIEDLGQQSQNPWDKTEDLTQQTQTHFDKIEDLRQQSQNPWNRIEDLGQQTQTQFDKLEDFGQQSQTQWDKYEDLGQHAQTQWNKYNEFDQQSQSYVGQEQATWNKLNKLNEDKYTHQINRDQIYSNTFTDDITHYIDKQTESGHKEQTVEGQNYFNTHISNDFHSQHTDESLSDSRTQHTSSINSLWDKLDRLSRESKFDSNHNPNEYTSLIENEFRNNFSKVSTTTEKIVVTDKNMVHPKDLGRGDIPDATVVHSKNMGRGDIPDTPEGFEFLKHSSTTEKHNEVSSTSTASIFNKRNKTEYETPPDIKALSLTTKNDEMTEKSMRNAHESNRDSAREIVNQLREHLSNNHNVNKHLGQQVSEERDKQSQNHLLDTFNSGQQSENVYEQNTKPVPTSKPSENYNKLHLNQGLEEYPKEFNENYDHQYMNHYYGGFDQQSKNLDQNNMQQESQHFKKPVQITDLQNLDQNLVDFSKWNKNFDQHNINQHPEGSDQLNQRNFEQDTQMLEKPVENVDQQNLDQNIVVFNKWNENLDQQRTNSNTESFVQQNQRNMEQELQSFDKLHDDFDQQDLNQNLVDFSQTHHINDEQHTVPQQKIEQEIPYEKPSASFSQQNLNQNLEDFGKFNQNFDLQSMGHHYDQFDQQNENLEQYNVRQELQNFDKPVKIFDQQDTNLGTHDFKTPSDSFDQQKNQNFEKLDKTLIGYNFQHQQQTDFGSGRDNYDHHNMHQRLRSPALESEHVQKQVAKSNSEQLDIQENNKLSSIQDEQHTVSHTPLQPPPELEKNGFWASVGKKFISAKDKVSSWFRK